MVEKRDPLADSFSVEYIMDLQAHLHWKNTSHHLAGSWENCGLFLQFQQMVQYFELKRLWWLVNQTFPANLSSTCRFELEPKPNSGNQKQSNTHICRYYLWLSVSEDDVWYTLPLHIYNQNLNNFSCLLFQAFLGSGPESIKYNFLILRPDLTCQLSSLLCSWKSFTTPVDFSYEEQNVPSMPLDCWTIRSTYDRHTCVYAELA